MVQSLTGSGIVCALHSCLRFSLPATCKTTAHRELEEDAKEDEDIAALLQGTGGDPEVIKQRVSLVHTHFRAAQVHIKLWQCADEC